MTDSFEQRIRAAQEQLLVVQEKKRLTYPGSAEWERLDGSAAHWESVIEQIRQEAARA